MMNDYTKYTEQELIDLRNTAEEEFKQCQDIIRQAYAEMKMRSDEYLEITNTLSKLNNGKQ